MAESRSRLKSCVGTESLVRGAKSFYVVFLSCDCSEMYGRLETWPVAYVHRRSCTVAWFTATTVSCVQWNAPTFRSTSTSELRLSKFLDWMKREVTSRSRSGLLL